MCHNSPSTFSFYHHTLAFSYDNVNKDIVNFMIQFYVFLYLVLGRDSVAIKMSCIDVNVATC